MSVAPPGENGTTILIALLGYACAEGVCAAAADAAKTRITRHDRRFIGRLLARIGIPPRPLWANTAPFGHVQAKSSGYFSRWAWRQRTAIGATAEPVAPLSFSGCT